MAKHEPPKASPKLLGLVKDFQAIASMAGYLTHTLDPPQLRLMFTLYGRLLATSESEAAGCVPGLQAWCERLALDLREGSSSAILPPQIQIAHPQSLPGGQWQLVATLTFTTKVTDASYLRVRTAVVKAYKRALALREGGLAHAVKLLDTVEGEDGCSGPDVGSPPAPLPDEAVEITSAGAAPAGLD